jgi:hypothetical protein
MASKKSAYEMNRVRAASRKVGLAYIGAFGVVGDELGSLFDRFVTRGERMELDLRKRLKRNKNGANKLAADLEHETKEKTARATKSVRKTVKRAEQAVA